MRVALLLLGSAALLGCPTNPPIPPDAGEDAGADAGPSDAGADAGPDAGRPDEQCSVAAQDCDAGSCMHAGLVDGGQGTRCLVGACDLVRQDCPAGEKCSYVGDGGAFARGCTPEGSADLGQPCTGTPSSNTCKKGLICALRAQADGGSASVCVRFCHSTADCASPQQCYVLVSIAGSDERPLVCGDPPPSCNPLAQDCARATDGCYPGPTGAACYVAGARSDTDACTFANDCKKASTCVLGQPSACRQLCRYPSGSPACSSGTCTKLSGHLDVGVCL
ncbi:MAG: hypothetical protein HYZ28_18075 [Myxococcales bacterium]|nr:hypothetical protein [Myxococcales bacterium]